MKIYSIVLISLLLLSLPGCVQKSYKKIFVITLSVPNKNDITSVGIRGQGKPLTWDYDFEMQPIVKDSSYTATISAITGYKFTEIKFTVNGDFELKGQPNRRIYFNDNDTTYYEAVFDSLPVEVTSP
jgi:PBP1b-binding outer membrane lipoprotein LpoB